MAGDFGDHYGSGDFEDVFTIKENGTYLIRFICAVKKVSRVWIPVLVPNEDNGYDESWRAFVVNNDTIFNEFATCHINAQLQAGVKESNARSPFKDQPMHVYLIFNRKSSDLKVEIGEFKWTVRKQLIDLQEQMDPKNSNLFRHGAYYMWDAEVIRRIKDKSSFIEYKVAPYENKFASRVPAGFKVDDPVKRNIFKAEEMQAIDNFKAERGITKLEEFGAEYESHVWSSEELITFFMTSAKIDFNRITAKGFQVFNKVETLLPMLQDRKIRYALGEHIETVQEQGTTFPPKDDDKKSEPEKKDGDWGDETEKKVEDAEWEEVKDEKKEEPKAEKPKEETSKETPKKEEPKKEVADDGDDEW